MRTHARAITLGCLVMFSACASSAAVESAAAPATTAVPSTTTEAVVSTSPEVADITTTTTSTTTTATPPAGPEFEPALRTARRFIEALAAGDAERVADHAVDGHFGFFIRESLSRLGDELTWLDAIGWSMTIDECTVTNPDLTNTRVTCAVTHSDVLSESLGAGPYAGAYHMRVRHEGDAHFGQVLEATAVTEQLTPEFPSSVFIADTWEPVVSWLHESHPGDVELMLGGDSHWLPGQRDPALTDESIELWSEHAPEFVAAHGSGA